MQSCDSATPAILKIVTQKNIFFILKLRSCDSATPAIPKIKSKKYISIYFYWLCDPATLRFQKLLVKKIQFIYIDSAILRSCDSAIPATQKKVCQKIFHFFGFTLHCDSAILATLSTLLFPGYTIVGLLLLSLVGLSIWVNFR